MSPRFCVWAGSQVKLLLPQATLGVARTRVLLNSRHCRKYMEEFRSNQNALILEEDCWSLYTLGSCLRN